MIAVSSDSADDTAVLPDDSSVAAADVDTFAASSVTEEIVVREAAIIIKMMYCSNPGIDSQSHTQYRVFPTFRVLNLNMNRFRPLASVHNHLVE